MSGKYTEEELALLSPTEREALTATDEEDDETLSDIAGDDEDEDGEDDDEGEEDKPADDAAASDEVKDAGEDKGEEDKPAPAASEDFDIEDIPAVPFKPVFSAELTETNQAAMDALESKLDEGEISQADFRKAERQIIGANLTEVNSKIEWQAEQDAFFKANKEYKADADKFKSLNAEVLKVANNSPNLTGIQILTLAKRNLEEAEDFAAFRAARKAGKSVEAAAAEVKKVAPKPAAKRPDHQTLRDVPAADNADVGQDKFAHLDKLSGLKLEAAIAKMTDAEQREYLEGA